MRKGALAIIVIAFMTAGAMNASAAKPIDVISPFGGQFFAAKKAEGNTAKVRVKFFCPVYETEQGVEITYRNYYVWFMREGSAGSFNKAAQRDGDGRCFVQYRFRPGTWVWQVRVDMDGSRSERSDFFVESSRPVGPLTLTRGAANRYMRIGLARKFGANWDYGFRKRTKCNRRVSRDRIRCGPITWFNGDLVFQGHGRVWFTYSKESAYWNYSFRIKKINEYCLSRGGSMAACSRTVVAR